MPLENLLIFLLTSASKLKNQQLQLPPAASVNEAIMAVRGQLLFLLLHGVDRAAIVEKPWDRTFVVLCYLSPNIQ